MENKEFAANKNAVLVALKDLLEYKNEKYGNSALKPINVFYKGNSLNSIAIRLDDKLNRLLNSSEVRLNDIADVAGYLTLYLISAVSSDTKDGVEEPAFSDKVKGALRYASQWIAPSPEEDSLMVFYKSTVDKHLEHANIVINQIKNIHITEEVSTEMIGQLLGDILSYMAENNMLDLSQFKD